MAEARPAVAFDVEDIAGRETQHALDRRGDVLVHPVRELDDDDGAFSRRSHEPTRHCS
jgi:hypothetical protein